MKPSIGSEAPPAVDSYNRPAARSARKAELHCHSDGLLDPAMLRQLIAAGHDPGIDPFELDSAHPVSTKLDWFERYDKLVQPAYNDPASLTPLLGIHVRRLAAQNVRYCELMLSGLMRSDMSTGEAMEVLQGYRRTVEEAAGGALDVVFLIGVGRGSPQQVERKAARVLELHAAGLVSGLALAGEESFLPVRAYRSTFERLKASGMGIEIHAGEWMGPESVRDALENGFPDRLGHAVSLFEDDSLIAEVRDRGIHLEFCPTSNLATGALARLDDHPVRKARDLGMSFSVSTDDPGPFGCSMTSEYELLAQRFGFGAGDFESMWEHAMAASFKGR